LPKAESLEGFDGAPMPAFIALTRLFTFLDGDLLDTTAAAGDLAIQARQKDKVSMLQYDLEHSRIGEDLNESQCVDLQATRNWIRTLLWQYTITHFAVSCHAQDQAFSALLPANIAHDMLSTIQKVSWKSVEPHGYGMVSQADSRGF
jgi:hypothetical protein